MHMCNDMMKLTLIQWIMNLLYTFHITITLICSTIIDVVDVCMSLCLSPLMQVHGCYCPNSSGRPVQAHSGH